jgi:hypothetical protein
MKSTVILNITVAGIPGIATVVAVTHLSQWLHLLCITQMYSHKNLNIINGVTLITLVLPYYSIDIYTVYFIQPYIGILPPLRLSTLS